MQDPVDRSAVLALRQLQQPGEADTVAGIITCFLEEATQCVGALRLAAESSNPLHLEQAAHVLKGISGTVGANEMFDLAVHLERIGRAGHTEGAVEAITQLRAAVHRARPIFERLRDSAE